MLKDMKRANTDGRRVDVVLPQRIVYATEGVERKEWLLECGDMQTEPAAKDFTLLSTSEGKKAAILLDF